MEMRAYLGSSFLSSLLQSVLVQITLFNVSTTAMVCEERLTGDQISKLDGPSCSLPISRPCFYLAGSGILLKLTSM